MLLLQMKIRLVWYTKNFDNCFKYENTPNDNVEFNTEKQKKMYSKDLFHTLLQKLKFVRIEKLSKVHTVLYNLIKDTLIVIQETVTGKKQKIG